MGDHVLPIQGGCTKPSNVRNLERSKEQRKDCYDLGSVQKVGPLGNPCEEPDSCPAKRTGTYRAKMWDDIISNERVVKSALCSFSMLDVKSSEDEDDLFSSDEEGGHNVWIIFLEVVRQSFGEGFFEDEELARTALSCHLSMDLVCQGMSDG